MTAKTKTAASRTAKKAKGSARSVAAVAKVVDLKQVGKVVQNPQGVSRAVFNPGAKIVVLPAGKENPRRQGTARWKRHNDLLKSKTVGDFLAKHPRWHATISRAVISKFIELR